MLNILMVCGAGLGSSFACQMSVETVLQDLGVEAKLDHCDISSASGMRANIIIQAAVTIGLIAMLGLLLQKKPFGQVVSGTMKTMLGFMVLSAGSSIIVESLTYFEN